MIDCGFSARNTVQKLTALDIKPQSVCGILITHEHTDHVRGAPVFSRGCGAPVLATAGTIASGGLSALPSQELQYSVRVEHHGFGITPIRISHDACEPCAYLIEVDGKRALFATDLGTTEGFDFAAVGALDYLYVEANHDADMLCGGPYPAFLKARIASDEGHLDNAQSGRLIKVLAEQSPNLRGVMLAHLSDKNNTAALALGVAQEWAGEIPGARWVVAQQGESTVLK